MNRNSAPKLSQFLYRDIDKFSGKVFTVVDVGARYGYDPMWEYAFGQSGLLLSRAQGIDSRDPRLHQPRNRTHLPEKALARRDLQ
jgi:hypothetical protein